MRIPHTRPNNTPSGRSILHTSETDYTCKMHERFLKKEKKRIFRAEDTCGQRSREVARSGRVTPVLIPAPCRLSLAGERVQGWPGLQTDKTPKTFKQLQNTYEGLNPLDQNIFKLFCGTLPSFSENRGTGVEAGSGRSTGLARLARVPAPEQPRAEHHNPTAQGPTAQTNGRLPWSPALPT